MIGRLRGVLAEVEEGHCLIDCAGVGYVVACGAPAGASSCPRAHACVGSRTGW